MSYKQRIYENFDDYTTLEEEFDNDVDNFYSAMESEFNGYYDYYGIDWLIDNGDDYDAMVSILLNLVCGLSYPIWKEYHSDKLAYKDYNVFISRLMSTMMYRISKWYMNRVVISNMMWNINVEELRSKGSTKSKITEKGLNGSNVIQESASTPTGIETNNGEDMTLTLEKSGNQSEMETSDEYPHKYTNFVGKSRGMHKNDVTRDTDISRTSDYGLAMDILEKIPYSYINELLSDISQHFIQVY